MLSPERLIGLSLDDARAIAVEHAKTVRPVATRLADGSERPHIVTMDLRLSRLNVVVDEAGIIVALFDRPNGSYY